MKNNVTLIGMPSAGKSTVGVLLAKRLGYSFIDVDLLIQEQEGKRLREIIEERMDFDQFSECELTMKDIDIIRRTITNALAGVYHDRVEYPKLRIGGKH